MKRYAMIVAVLLLGAAWVPSPPAHATNPGRNGRIAFSMDTGSGIQIHTIEPNGQGLTQLTSVTGIATRADWSPDGQKIVFGVGSSADEPQCHVEMMNADGSGLVDLTPKSWLARGGCAYDPSFFPHGRRIVFVGTRCHNEIKCPRTMRSMNLQGEDRRRILRIWNIGDFDLHTPRVSPDGRTIVFTVVDETVVVNGEPGNRKALYTVRKNGTHKHQVTPYRLDVCICGGDWAPDGRRIVSSSQAGPTPVPGEPTNMFTIHPDGTHLRWLTHSHRTSVIIGVGSYSPNGRWILYKRITAAGNVRMMKKHPSGRGATLIARLPSDVLGRDWGPRPA
jgi:Tol biopolymer transport system component